MSWACCRRAASHSHQNHIAAVAKALALQGIPVAVHAFLDGRDTPPESAEKFVEDFKYAVAGASPIRIATVTGRYYAMDRDKRWERTADAYATLVDGKGKLGAGQDSVAKAIEFAWLAGETDEFVRPTPIGKYSRMNDGDGCVHGELPGRPGAARILSALLDPDFDGFDRPRVVNFAAALGMSEIFRAA